MTETIQVLAADLADDAVSVVDTGLEIFVIVPPAVRHQRVNIALAVRTASAMSEHLRVTRARPFRVPAHVLVFPTVVPADFSAAARACDLQILVRSDRKRVIWADADADSGNRTTASNPFG